MKLYKIKKGHHRSNSFLPKLTFKTEISFDLCFNESALYEYTNFDSVDWNKAYGFSDSWSKHHTNSARIAWRCKNGKLQLAAYVYLFKERIATSLGYFPLNTWIPCSIKLIGDSYLFIVNGVPHRVPRNPINERGLKYMLKPYFGGNNSAPHNISIVIKEH